MQPTEQARAHSWHPQSLLTLAHDPPAPPTIGGLLYPGKRTLLSGETESLKTWLALILAKAELDIEQTVAWVDLDDMGAGAILQRLRALQVDDTRIHDLFLYYTPDERLYDARSGRRAEAFNDVVQQLAERRPRMMVIDAFNPILTLHGLDPNSVTEIEAFWREIADPIARTGAAPVLLDHVVKNADQRGKYASGSERKASGATVHIGAHALEQLTIGGQGRAVLTTHKDRPAYLPRPTVGILKLVSEAAGDSETIGYELEEDKSHVDGKFRPTALMEKISRALEIIDEPASKNWIETSVKGKTDYKREALVALVELGHVTAVTGPRGTKQFTVCTPYREGDETPAETTSPHLAPPRPSLVSNTTSPLAPSFRKGEVGASVEAEGRGQQNGRAAHLFDDTQPASDDDEGWLDK